MEGGGGGGGLPPYLRGLGLDCQGEERPKAPLLAASLFGFPLPPRVFSSSSLLFRCINCRRHSRVLVLQAIISLASRLPDCTVPSCLHLCATWGTGNRAWLAAMEGRIHK
ncbi:hypothetical protein BT67DRAFT_240527 [Trichocladium antarcticum]|uniref:Uncharacterized protein n=1 Tax=Trichocladium antarcticum TaxID=1450529 RepID=A0AAN6UCJ3_9PEZI|nr:hypothetical protein BT67DRAFT_240527 [Trichocladium antarcticum]